MEFYSIKKIAELLEVHENTVRNWIKSGELPRYKIGNAVRIKEEDLKEFLEDKKERKCN